MSRSRALWLLAPGRCWGLVVAGVLLWFLAVVPAYYVVHNPLAGSGPSSEIGQAEPPVREQSAASLIKSIPAALLGLLCDLVLLALTVAVAAAWGSRIGHWLGLIFDSGLERWGLGAVLGLGLLGTLVLGLGVVQGLYHWAGYALLLALGLSAWREIGELLRWLRSGARNLQRIGRPWLCLYVSAIGLLSLGLALLPPTGWDSLVYHLQGPRLYLEAHRLLAVRDNFYLNWPAQVEMLFTWGLLLRGDTLAKLFHWIFWPLTAALLYALARRSAGAGTGRWAVALWAAVPFASELAGLAYVDLALTAFATAGVYAFLRWTESPGDGWLVLAAILAGLGLATKYTAAAWLAALILLLAYHALRHQRRPLGWVALRAAGVVTIAGLVVSPWLVKNWIVTGNPIYPLLFGGEGWNPTREAWLNWPGHGYSHNLLDYLALPWLMTVLGTSKTAAFDATVGPLLLVLGPLAFLVRGRPRAVNYGLALAGGQLACFAVTVYRHVYLAETRLLLPAFPLLCLAAAFGLQHLPAWDRPQFHLSRAMGGMVCLVLLTNLVTEVRACWQIRPLAPLLGLESRDDYLLRRLGAHAAAMDYLADRLPGSATVFFLWEPRGYYAQRPADADETLDNLAQLRVTWAEADDPPGSALADLRSRGFTHLLLYRTGLDFLQGPTPRPPTLSRLARPTFLEGSFYPFTEDDWVFLEALLARCQRQYSLFGAYEIYQIQ